MKFEEERKIKVCSVCGVECCHFRIYTLTLIDGLKDVEFRTTHPVCRRYLEKVLKAEQNLKDAQLNLEYHIFTMKN